MEKEWVIVFLIYADFRTKESFSMSEELKIEINEMFKNLINTSINPKNSKVFVILNGIRYLINVQNDVPRIETKTVLYEIIRSKKDRKNTFGHCRVIDSAILQTGQPLPTNLQTVRKLKQIFAKIHVKKTANVFFITHDHGSAFGIFRSSSLPLPVPHTPIDDPDALRRFPYLRMFWEKALTLKDFQKTYKDHLSENDSMYPRRIIQFRQSLFKLPVKDRVSSFLIKRLFDKQYAEFFEIIVNREKKAELIFNKVKFMNFYQLKENVELTTNEHELFNSNIDLKAELEEAEAAEILKNEELADAIKCWLKEKKVGVLLMMNCWMMNLHTMYSMRDCAECLVAPQGDIANPGYNYRDILRYIYKSNSISPQDLAITCVTTCEKKYAKKRAKKLNIKHPDTINFWKIIAVDLQVKKDGINLLQKQLEILKKLVDIINKNLLDTDYPELRYLLKYVRSVCFDFSNNESMMVDILNWGLSIRYADEDFHPSSPKVPNDISICIAELRDAINLNSKPSLILKATLGNSVYEDPDNDPSKIIGVIKLEPTGYSLFFPVHSISDSYYINLRDNLATDRLLIEFLSNWKAFLKDGIDSTISF